MSITNKDVVLEWSFSQKCFHINEIVDSLRMDISH